MGLCSIVETGTKARTMERMVRGEAGFIEECNKARLLYEILYLENGRLSSAKNDEIELIAV